MLSPLGLFIALCAAILFTSYGLLSRVLAKDSEDPLALSVVYQLYGALFSVPLFFLEPWKFGITPQIIFITFLATIFFGIFQGTEFFSRKYLEASRLTVMFQITPVVTFIASILLLHESFSLTKTIATFLIVFGNIVAVQKHGGHITKKGMTFALITVCSLGLAYVADKAVFAFYPLGVYAFITYLFPGMYAFLFVRNPLRVAKEFKKGSWWLPVLGIISVAGYYLLLKTFQVAEASVAVPVIYISTILTAFGGIFILKEQSNIPQKILGAVFAFIGVILLL